MKSESELRNDIVEVGRRIWQKGFVAANDGNISARLSETEILATPTGVSKGFLTPQMLVKLGMDGRVIQGDLKPSSEVKMHLAMYREREDICAVVHAHPPTATGFAVAGMALDRPTLPEVVVSLKAIPLAEYGTPSTDELPESVMPYLGDYDAFLLANHGTLTLGRDVYQAYYRLETLEHCAQISLAARLLGTEQTLTQPQVNRLLELRQNIGVEDRSPCLGCGVCDARESTRRFVETCSGYAGPSPAQTQSAPGGRPEDGAGERPCGMFASCPRPDSTAKPTVSDDELREIVTRVARQVLAGNEGENDALWRD